ncbi:MAG: rod shape-determining protein [Limnochordaceae bacterium]|nr:rod shape-determining protein [Limnochordaceae bacterium]
MFGMDLGIDLGTATILVYVRGRGVVLREPSVVAIDKDTGQVKAVGEQAREMIGRTPGNIVAIRPMREGVIADYDVTQKLLEAFISRVAGRRHLFGPRVVVGVPSGVTSVERRAVVEAATQAGARSVFLITEPMAAAIGAGLNVDEASGNMVVDIGGGSTDIAVISLGGEVVSEQLRVAGDRMDEAVARYVRRVHNLMIGERTAEEIKIQIGTALPADDDASMDVRGRDMVTGLPRTVTLHSNEVYEALQEPLMAILESINRTLEQTPPELAADIMDKGIVLTGGGSLLKGLPTVIAERTGTPVHLAEDPVSCVALGTGKYLEALDRMDRRAERPSRYASNL